MIPYKCIDCRYEEGLPQWLIDEMKGAKDLLTNPDNYLDMPLIKRIFLVNEKNNPIKEDCLFI